MNRFLSSTARNCRESLPRAKKAAERLAREWQEIRRHATIEEDPEKLLRLRAKLDERKGQVDAMSSRNQN